MATEEHVKWLEKELQKRKRIAAEWAGKMHDLAEETTCPNTSTRSRRSPTARMAACLAWKEIADELKAAKAATEVSVS